MNRITAMLLLTFIFDVLGAKPDISTDRSFADWLFANGRYDLALAEYMKIQQRGHH